jgi:cytochrome c peroxidase
MRTAFRTAMAKLAALGNDRSSLVDCSSVIPNPADDGTEPTLPGGKVADDIEGSVSLALI